MKIGKLGQISSSLIFLSELLYYTFLWTVFSQSIWKVFAHLKKKKLTSKLLWQSKTKSTTFWLPNNKKREVGKFCLISFFFFFFIITLFWAQTVRIFVNSFQSNFVWREAAPQRGRLLPKHRGGLQERAREGVVGRAGEAATHTHWRHHFSLPPPPPPPRPLWPPRSSCPIPADVWPPAPCSLLSCIFPSHGGAQGCLAGNQTRPEDSMRALTMNGWRGVIKKILGTLWLLKCSGQACF